MKRAQRAANAYQPALLVDSLRGRRLVCAAAFGFGDGARNCTGRRNKARSDTRRDAARTRRLKKKPRNHDRMPSTGCTFFSCSASNWLRVE